jgi:glycine dehydrogenase subunit 2
MPEPLMFEASSEGRKGYSLPRLDVPEQPDETLIPAAFLRRRCARLPELSELEVMRHFNRLSAMNHHVEKDFYPLGSCTMKYNPKINENIARLDGFSQCHPLQPESTVQGSLMLMGELSEWLCEIAGLDSVTLQPAAGAHGEMTGIKMVRAYHEDRGNPRRVILLPDSAHGTNPASAAVSGYEIVQIRSAADGLVDLQDLRSRLGPEVACLMLTNPNTLGLFETRIREMSKMVHETGALMYMDGANLNALLGIVRPGDLGFDLIHFNLHKTFSAPHGGGGPGSGPVGVKSILCPYLPVPVLVRSGNAFSMDFKRPKSIGKMTGFWGHFGVLVRAYVYIRMLGSEGLRRVSEDAILNANYLMRRLESCFQLPHTQAHMHEFVLSGDRQKNWGVKTLDMAKRLLDYGVHAPTVYFPLIVHEAMMIEPTETESKETLDSFVETMLAIEKEAETRPDLLLSAPHNTPVGRLDEGMAARDLNVRYDFKTTP